MLFKFYDDRNKNRLIKLLKKTNETKGLTEELKGMGEKMIKLMTDHEEIGQLSKKHKTEFERINVIKEKKKPDLIS